MPPKRRPMPVVHSSPIKQPRNSYEYEDANSMQEMPAQHSCNCRSCPCSRTKKSLPQVLTRGYLMRQISLAETEACRSAPLEDQPKSNRDNVKDPTAKEDDVPIFTAESNLVHHVSGLYEKAVNGEVTSVSAVRGMSSAARHFFTVTASHPSPSIASHQLIATHLLSPRSLAAKHSDSTPENQIAEYQLQILLQAELESLVSCEEERAKKAAQIATMLRKISFMTDVATMMAFLTDSLLECYKSSVPSLLRDVYDDLLQPWPACLSDDTCLSPSQASPVSRGVQSPVFARNLRSSAKKRRTTSPDQNKPQRSLKRTFSIDLKKTFQIAVAKPKNGKAKPSSAKRNKQQTPKKRSVSPVKHTPTKAAGSSASGRRREVQDTPAGKQRSNVVWHRLDRSRRRTLADGDLDVVGESPLKMSSAVALAELRSPRRHTPNKQLLPILQSPRSKLVPTTGSSGEVLHSPRRVAFASLCTKPDIYPLDAADLDIVWNSPQKPSAVIDIKSLMQSPRQNNAESPRRAAKSPRHATCTGLVDRILRSPGGQKSGAGSSNSMVRRRSFYSSAPENTSRSVLRYEKLEKRMTDRRLLSPLTANRLSQPSRRVQTTNFFNVSYEASPTFNGSPEVTGTAAAAARTNAASSATPLRGSAITPKKRGILVSPNKGDSNHNFSLTVSGADSSSSGQTQGVAVTSVSDEGFPAFLSPGKSTALRSPAARALLQSPRCSPRQNLLNRYSSRLGTLQMS